MEELAQEWCLWANQSFRFSFSHPCLEPACQPQCSTCTSGLECSSCQPPLLMQHGQCVPTCGDGFYQDRHSCAGNHWLGPKRSGATGSCEQLFKFLKKLLMGWKQWIRDDMCCFYNLISTLVMRACGKISLSPSKHAWGHWNCSLVSSGLSLCCN